jgi:hypothetical protein
MKKIEKSDLKVLKRMAGEREIEITKKCYRECRDGDVRKEQADDQILKTLYKLIDIHSE